MSEGCLLRPSRAGGEKHGLARFRRSGSIVFDGTPIHQMAPHDIVRLGIGHPGDKALVADYVLSPPAPEEREAIEHSLDKCLEAFPLIESGQMQAAMLKLHTKTDATRAS